MEEAENETKARFAAVVEALARKPGVTHSKAGSRLFGSKALKVHDKIHSESAEEWLHLAREALEFVGT